MRCWCNLLLPDWPHLSPLLSTIPTSVMQFCDPLMIIPVSHNLPKTPMSTREAMFSCAVCTSMHNIEVMFIKTTTQHHTHGWNIYPDVPDTPVTPTSWRWVGYCTQHEHIKNVGVIITHHCPLNHLSCPYRLVTISGPLILHNTKAVKCWDILLMYCNNNCESDLECINHHPLFLVYIPSRTGRDPTKA